MVQLNAGCLDGTVYNAGCLGGTGDCRLSRCYGLANVKLLRLTKMY